MYITKVHYQFYVCWEVYIICFQLCIENPILKQTLKDLIRQSVRSDNMLITQKWEYRFVRVNTFFLSISGTGWFLPVPRTPVSEILVRIVSHTVRSMSDTQRKSRD